MELSEFTPIYDAEILATTLDVKKIPPSDAKIFIISDSLSVLWMLVWSPLII